MTHTHFEGSRGNSYGSLHGSRILGWLEKWLRELGREPLRFRTKLIRHQNHVSVFEDDCIKQTFRQEKERQNQKESSNRCLMAFCVLRDFHMGSSTETSKAQ